MKNILIPYDFTEVAENALVYAISLFENLEVTFYLLHVYESTRSNLLSQEKNQEWFNQMDDSVEANLKQHVRELNEKTSDNHSFRSIVLSDSITNSVKQIIKVHLIDLVISGTKGVSEKNSLFMTTRTLQIINSTNECPILVIPSNYEYMPIKKVMFSTNFKNRISPKIIKSVIDILTIFDAHLEILNLSEEEYLSEKQRENKRSLESILMSFSHEFKKVDWSDSEATSLSNYLKASGGQLLCLVKHKQNFFYRLLEEDVIKRSSFYTKFPLLVIPL